MVVKTQIAIVGFAILLGIGCTVQKDANEVSAAEQQDAIASSNGLVELTENTEYETIRVVEVAGGLEHPWSFAFLPDGQILVTERSGRLNLLTNGEVTEITGIPELQSQGQGGLLEVSVHPNYEETGWIYLTYSKPNGNGETATALARGRLEGTTLVDVEDIFVQNRYSQPGRHYGSRLAWTTDGKLLMTIGDRGSEPPRAQDLTDHAGSLLRLNDDGSVPEDNPFVNNDEALDEIYAYGLRNIQGMIVDPATNEIWVTDHGPRGGDELNRIEPGNNYGWPLVTLGLDYGTEDPFPDAVARRMEGLTEPFYEFLPTHAPSGLALITADRFPAWQGNLLVGGLRSERIRRVVFDDSEVLHEEELLLGKIGRIRDVREAPDGTIYVLTDESNGGLYRIEPGNG
ncbi:hypothetical protein C7B61_06565 [filamentous cyanobacterium CCP1]|nr:hypothetical protein C7B76_06150 [filamentous cyanobacterium CCP2]PSB67362.1 hypothetical protein C7B61_06565 [filamentous cyanobacterium CCP1]